MSLEDLKKQAAYQAVDTYVRSGMVLGLGTGSTVKYAIDRLGELLANGTLTDIKGIPTSVATEKQSISLNIPLVELHEITHIDVAIDGADEIDTDLNLVKGRGGALLREKMVEELARLLVIIADETKDTPEGLGAHGAMPVEVTRFGADHVLRRIQALPSIQEVGARASFRMNGSERYVTDNGNYIVDLFSEKAYTNAQRLANELSSVVGVVEHGLFLGMADVAILATRQHGVKVVQAKTKKAAQL